MDEAVVAQNAPYVVELEAGKIYAWCSCGLSQKQPFCDGSHKTTSLLPIKFKAEQDGKAYLCGCKGSGNKPHCDGSHKAL